MSETHEVTTLIRGPNTELPHPQRTSNGYHTTQSIGVGDANDKNNNQEKSSKNVLKKAQVPPPTLPKSNRPSPNGIDRDDTNRPDNCRGRTLNEAASRPPSAVSSPGIVDDVQKSLPKTNRSTLSTIRAKGQPTTHEDGATVRATNTAVNDSEANCSIETTHSRTSNDNGKSALVPLPHSFRHTTCIVYPQMLPIQSDQRLSFSAISNCMRSVRNIPH